VKLPLGWSLFGPSVWNAQISLQVSLVQTNSLQQQLEDKWKANFRDTNFQDGPQMSKEDRHALDLMEGCVKFNDGYYELPLLRRPEAPSLPQNCELAIRRLTSLRRLQRDDLSQRLCQCCSELHWKGLLSGTCHIMWSTHVSRVRSELCLTASQNGNVDLSLTCCYMVLTLRTHLPAC